MRSTPPIVAAEDLDDKGGLDNDEDDFVFQHPKAIFIFIGL